MDEFDQRIAEAAYEKLWTELSGNDKRVMLGIAKAKDHSVKAIREAAGMDANKLNQYRRRLKNRGLMLPSIEQFRLYCHGFRSFWKWRNLRHLRNKIQKKA